MLAIENKRTIAVDLLITNFKSKININYDDAVYNRLLLNAIEKTNCIAYLVFKNFRNSMMILDEYHRPAWYVYLIRHGNL